MGNDQHTARTRAASPNDQVRFAVLLTVVAAAVITVLLVKRPKGMELERPLRVILRAADERHRSQQASGVRRACKHHDCGCVEIAARAGLDVDTGRAVLDLFDAGKDCTFPAREGMRAEALVRDGQVPEGRRAANRVLETNRRDAHATSALGVAAYREGAWPAAAELLTRSVTFGAGDGARAVAGLAFYQLNDFGAARKPFEAMLASEPADLSATYNLALIAQKQDRYGEARKLYLTVLRADKEHKQARYNLAILAHSIGAEGEARHHLAELERLAPGDPMLQTLRQALAQPSSRRGQVLTLGASPAASAR